MGQLLSYFNAYNDRFIALCIDILSILNHFVKTMLTPAKQTQKPQAGNYLRLYTL